MCVRLTCGCVLVCLCEADDVGLDVLPRVFNPLALGGIGANYYPQIFEAYIEDDRVRMSVLNQQPHGVSSVSSGELEVMLHRRTNYSCCGKWHCRGNPSTCTLRTQRT